MSDESDYDGTLSDDGMEEWEYDFDVDELVMYYWFRLAKKQLPQGSNRPTRVRSSKFFGEHDAKGVEALYQDIRAEGNVFHNNFLSMGISEFDELLHLIGPHLLEASDICPSISVTARFLVTLRYLATGETYESLQFLTRIPQKTISRIILEVVFWIINCLRNTYLKCPSSPEEWFEIAKGFYEKWDFVTLGPIDGKHCCTERNSGNSIVLIAIADANYRFIYACFGAFNDENNDGGMWIRSFLRKSYEAGRVNIPPPALLPGSPDLVAPYAHIGKDAFALKDYNMKGFTGQQLSAREKYFNYRLSGAQKVIDGSFGILSNRWKILQTHSNVSPSRIYATQGNMNVHACVILHNFLRTKMMDSENDTDITDTKMRKCNLVPYNFATEDTTEDPENTAENFRNVMMNYYCDQDFYDPNRSE